MEKVLSAAKSVNAQPGGLSTWMDRVLERAANVERTFGAEDVHDLRVALRRCRTIAAALSEVHPGPGWRKLKRASRPLFRALGALRDVQVQRAWLRKLAPPGEPLRVRLLRRLAHQERDCREKAEKALGRLDRKAWEKLARKLEPKAAFFPPESVVFERLALARLNTAIHLDQQARRRRSSIAWHRVRIALKEFRYVVANFLPGRYQAWGADLKACQDLLGEVHDLDVLRAEIRRISSAFDDSETAKWRERIENERQARLRKFLSRMSGPDSLWLAWRKELPLSRSLADASVAARRTA